MRCFYNDKVKEIVNIFKYCVPYILHLTGIDEATETFQDIVMEVPETKSSGGAHFPPSPRQVDTLHRRLSLVKKAVSTLRDGLNIQHHPSLMSEHRMMLLSEKPIEMVHG